MEVGSPDWIEASLAKLEQLEQQRATHEHAIATVKEPLALRRHTDALGKLDAEIKALYAQLESFAEDDDDEEEEQEQEAAAVATPERRTVGDETLSAPHLAAASIMPLMQAAPLAQPISNAPSSISPPASPPASPPFSAPVSIAVPAPSPRDDDDIPTGGSGKWIFLGLVVVAGLGVGGFFMLQNMNKAKDKPAPTAGSVEIKAAEVPEDTEAPKAAKGADVDRTPTGNGTATPVPTKKDTKKDATKKVIKLGDDGDPLG